MNELVPVARGGRPTVIVFNGGRVFVSVHDAAFAADRRRWKLRLADAHPDRQGSPSAFRALHRAYERWLETERAWYAAHGVSMPVAMDIPCAPVPLLALPPAVSPPVVVAPVRPVSLSRAEQAAAARRVRERERRDEAVVALRASRSLREAAVRLHWPYNTLRRRLARWGITWREERRAKPVAASRRAERRARLTPPIVAALQESRSLREASDRLGWHLSTLCKRLFAWQIDADSLLRSDRRRGRPRADDARQPAQGAA